MQTDSTWFDRNGRLTTRRRFIGHSCVTPAALPTARTPGVEDRKAFPTEL
ncbi:twin-arginine translocation signal domain-containing protein [Paraburkholderia caribensis]